MDDLGGSLLPENIRCLVGHKMKARVIRQNMLLNGSNKKEENAAKKVIKFDTFLSHQMLDRIKTADLKIFEA